MPFAPVPDSVRLADLELEVAARWRERDIFRRSITNREGSPDFVFYEGPPTANGLPHMGHVIQRTFKDLFPRYQTMRGKRCLRKGGWDTHGLPVEIEVEKELGLTGKQQIEEFGIAEFNQRCRESVFRYIDAWTDFTRRLGLWLDLDDPYVTYKTPYMESVWAILKRIWDRGLLYRGYKVVPYCPRCATPLSSHELSQGYRDDVEDPSVYVRFRLEDDPSTSLLAWTTTPWTLPGNVALAVGPGIDYVKVRHGEESLILAQARLGVLQGEYEVVEHLSAEQLVGLRYRPLFEFLIPDEPAFFVVDAPFVSVEEGTGVVHTAAAYGEDDLRLCQERGVPVRHVVDLRGRFRAEVLPFAGLFVKDADPLIIEDLRGRGLLYRDERIRHTYPFCWRCETPLLYYALDSWFIRMSAVRDELLRANGETSWHPEHIRDGRMGDWLQNLQDWSLSRLRYWGTPLPIWVCEKCGTERCVGSVAELGLSLDDDLHRPGIDRVTLGCDCGGTMSRVPDLIDVWFDSGSMPFAQYHWPFENAELQRSQFPADFIAEGLDQTRGWFYSLLAIAVLMEGGNAYRNCLVNGTVLDRAGRKQSKRLGNTDDPVQLMERFGADALRWYVCTAASIGGDYRFMPEAVEEAVRFLGVKLWNSYKFIVLYARTEGWEPSHAAPPVESRPALDRWVLARLHQTLRVVTSELDAFDFHSAARELETLLGDVSDWYIRRSRRRFWKPLSPEDQRAAFATLHEVLVSYAAALAPFCPFVTDHIWTSLTAGESVHLSDYPVARDELIDVSLLAEMQRARRIVETGLAAREEARINARKPLAGASVSAAEVRDELVAVICDELNLKSLRFTGGPDSSLTVALDTTLTEELRLEGLARELVRRLQVLRKKAGLRVEDRIEVRYRVSEGLQRAIATWEAYIRQEVLAEDLSPANGETGDGFASQELQFDGESAWLALRARG